MNDEKKRRRFFMRLVYIFIAAALASAAVMFFVPSLGSVMLTLSAASLAAAAFLTFRIFSSLEKRVSSVESVVANAEGYAEIRYDKKSETAYILGDFSKITGLEIVSSVLDETDYKKLVVDMISYPSDAGADIYMAARPESWIRIHTFENDDFEFTMISDVSELVSCSNIVKSLKYYDGETGMLCRDAFISKVASVSGSRAGTVGLVTLLINGVDKLTSFKGTAAADRVIAKAAAFIKKFENPHNVFSGRTATNEFCVLITDTYGEGCRKYADKLYSGLSEMLSPSEGSEYIRVYCGYAIFDGEENDAGTMMSAADYAAFEAASSAASEPVGFDRANYVLRAYDFKKIQVFNRIVGENMVNYHFQPVVDARTGAIFAYEALMRPKEIDGIKLSPLEVVEIAEKQGMSVSVECMTLKNTLSFLSANRDFFEDKKLFINAIPNCFISDEQYDSFYEEYGDVFGKLVVEVTEGVQISRRSIDVLRERYCGKGALIAMDDYGTGYSNESTLITIKPDFIKIDRSLIEGINSDVQKRHLVSNMIDFAGNHGIKTLGEGVETREELETLIEFGIDFIQGYYTSKPNAVLIPEIPTEIKDEILGINLKHTGYAKKVYRLESDAPCDIAEIAVNGYTDIVAASENVTLTAGTSRSVRMRISCEDGFSGVINISSVNIFGLEAPVLTLGKNCSVTLNVIGTNSFSYEGIRVPASSRLILTGSGSLNIDVNNDGVIFGGSCLQDFGAVRINMDGDLNISAQAENIVALGGGTGDENSSVDIAKGNVSVNLKGHSAVGIGTVSGSVKIRLGKCSVTISGDGQNVVAVGSKNGRVDIESGADVKASCTGDNCCVFGTLENGSGSMVFSGGSYDLAARAKNSAAMGSLGGSPDVSVIDGNYRLFCEGDSAAGVGNCFGSGNVTVSGGIFRMHIASSKEVSIGSEKGQTVIRGGNIVTDSREKIKAVSPFGTPLEELRAECTDKFSRKIVFGGNEYLYTAFPSEDEGFVSVYLPEGYKL